jgi:hypothetical protein
MPSVPRYDGELKQQVVVILEEAIANGVDEFLRFTPAETATILRTTTDDWCEECDAAKLAAIVEEWLVEREGEGEDQVQALPDSGGRS